VYVAILKKSKRMRKEKTDRNPDLEVSCDGHRSEGSQKHTGQVRSQVRVPETSKKCRSGEVSGQGVPET
jgi:hypothetical protein